MKTSFRYLRFLIAGMITCGAVFIAHAYFGNGYQNLTYIAAVLIALAAIPVSGIAFARERMLEGAGHISDVVATAKSQRRRLVIHHTTTLPYLIPSRHGLMWVGIAVSSDGQSTTTHRIYGFGDRELRHLEQAVVIPQC